MLQAATVLVAHGNPETAAAVRCGFERAGWSVTSQSAAGVALVVAGGTGDVGAWLRQSRRSGGAPVLFVGAESERMTAIEAGVDEFLPHPVALPHLVAAGTVLAGRSPGAQCSGRLTRLLDARALCGALCSLRRTGILRIAKAERHGEISLVDGVAVAAELGALRGESAFQHLLFWEAGRFVFHHDERPVRRNIPGDFEQVQRRADESVLRFRDIAGDIAATDVFVSGPAGDELVENLPGNARSVLELFDGHRSVIDVMQDSATGRWETLSLAKGLLAMELLAKVSARAASPTMDGALRSLAEVQAARADTVRETMPEWRQVLLEKDEETPTTVYISHEMQQRQRTYEEPALLPSIIIDAELAADDQAEAGQPAQPMQVAAAAPEPDIAATVRRPRGTIQPEVSHPATLDFALTPTTPVAQALLDVSGALDLPPASDLGRGTAPTPPAAPESAFSESEEAFFSAGKRLEQISLPRPESFSDLDEGYRVPTLWQRFWSQPRTLKE